MKMITISRQYGSGGDEIASLVCEKLGYKTFDKQLINQAAQEVGLSDQEIVDYSEENYKVRGFLDRLLSRSQPVAKTRIWKEDATGARVVEEFSLTEETAVALVQKAVLTAYQSGSLVIVGRGGQVILKDRPDVLHVRVEAPLDDRVQRVKQQMKLTREDFAGDVEVRREARSIVELKDITSRDYIRRFYHMDWSDPLLYHLVVNTGKLSVQQAAQIIVDLVQSSPTLKTDMEQSQPAG